MYTTLFALDHPHNLVPSPACGLPVVRGGAGTIIRHTGRGLTLLFPAVAGADCTVCAVGSSAPCGGM